jgi:3-deoxy-D-manno-octulosonic acid (KDO) 8-phosphate synthase
MTKAQITAVIQAIVRNQLDDCKRAIKDGTKTIALNELEDAIRQLKLLAKRLQA